ncbi:uncharacterized protein LOC115224533 [Octopus sinensis]|uniref:Uncharacterized protein LOC115224533 n=1 Tax=Octopus sinensis TaxID=2607531 RepID=A0A6P7TPB8_9MOLL|nr:uncharacterized protein LOC115224533 [Octopus sinensis]
MVSDLNELGNKVFPNRRNRFYRPQLAEHQFLERLPRSHHIYNSVATVLNIDEAEFLNSLTPHGLRPHHLHFKIGALVMLLRNFDPPKLCNSTGFMIKKMMLTVLETTILTSKESVEPIFIPRIPLILLDMTFLYKRLQFPLKLSFPMSINKVQGHSMDVVGLNLAEPVFSHDQHYAGCSRVGNPNHLFIYASQRKTKNVVYQEALQTK